MNDKNKNQGPDFSKFEQEQVGFPPYWEAGWIKEPDKEGKNGVGKWFYGKVIAFDGRDPDFERFVIQAGVDTECAAGPVREQRPVKVKVGEQFSVSAYGGLPLDRYFGLNVRCRITGTQDTGKPNPMWVFEISVSPETKKYMQTPAYQAQLRQAQAMMRPALPPRGARPNPRDVEPEDRTPALDEPPF